MNLYPRVAVLVASFNGSEWISSQILSINSQLDCSIHIFVRDDGSLDDTIEIIKKMAMKIPITIIDSHDFFTGSSAKNFFELIYGIDSSKFDYIAFADQDDIWFPEKIKNSIRLMIDTNSVAYSSNLIAFDNKLQRSWFIDKVSNKKRFDYLFQGASAGCTYVLSRSALDFVKVKLMDKTDDFPKFFSHDWVIYAICRSFDLMWVHDKRSFIAYRQHDRNVFGAKPGIKGFFARIELIKNGWYRGHILYLKKFIRCSPQELKIISAVERMNLTDRCYLIWNIKLLRREFLARLQLAFLIFFKIL
jgi:rhamnosyltransferase